MNPAFRVALNETLGRPATPEEWFTYSASLAKMLGGERVYIDLERVPDKVQHDTIIDMRGRGVSIREIARRVGLSKSQVHRVLSPIFPYETGHFCY